MKCMSFLLVLGLVIISLAGCGEAETREKILPDGRTIVVDAAGNIVPDGKLKPLEGYTYNEQTGRYVTSSHL